MDEDEEDGDSAWHAIGVDEDEGGEDEPDQDRLESHSKAGPHTAAAGAAKGIRLQRGTLLTEQVQFDKKPAKAL